MKSEPFQRFTGETVKTVDEEHQGFLITALKCGANENFKLTPYPLPIKCG
jgi:hypothetical protein